MINDDLIRPKPFLRWVGGKARVSSKLLCYFPPLSKDSKYFEPFLGAGGMFFKILPVDSVLADMNYGLIQCFREIKRHPESVFHHLNDLSKLQDKSSYYRFREEYNTSDDTCRCAALFIYLNKTCFNGIWRVSCTGRFNVPWGAKDKPGFPTRANLIAVANALSSAELIVGDFEESIASAVAGDVVYLDPPYLPLSATAYFRHYTYPRFSVDDHERVARIAHEMAARGVAVIITEADSAEVRNWYSDFEIVAVGVRRYVSGDGARNEAQELVIRSRFAD